MLEVDKNLAEGWLSRELWEVLSRQFNFEPVLAAARADFRREGIRAFLPSTEELMNEGDIAIDRRGQMSALERFLNLENVYFQISRNAPAGVFSP